MTDAQRFLDIVHPSGSSYVLCAIADTVVSRYVASREALPALLDDLVAYQERARGIGVYYSLAAFAAPPRRRGAEKEVTTIGCLWADVDKPTKGEARERVDAFGIPPSVLVDTGGGYQCIWMLRAPVVVDAASRLRVKGILRSLARRLGGDRTVDLARVFRLPGTENTKCWSPKYPTYTAPLPCVIVAESDARYTLDDFEVRETTAATTATAATATPSASFSATAVRSWLMRLPRDVDKPAVMALVAGQPFAVDGARHDVMLALTWRIAEKFPKLDDGALEALFSSSLAAMSDGAPTLDEVEVAYRGAVEKIAAGRREAQELIGGSALPDDDLTRIAEKHGWPADVLARRWLVLSRDGALWVLDDEGQYRGPARREAQQAMVRQHLARAPVVLSIPTERGTRWRPVVDLVGEAGIVVDHVVASLSAQRSTVTGSTFIEAVCPRRDLVARFDADVDRWLRIVGGNRLVDWVSAVPDLDRLLCALYLCGPPRSGKTLLAHGLAQMWSDQPTDISDVLGNFNDTLTRCPLVLADEEIPRQYQRQSVTALLRTLLSTHSRTLARKYLDTSTMTGAVRLVLAANHSHLLVSSGVLSSDDLAAIAERFLYFEVPAESSSFLDALPVDVREHWRRQAIAEHALYLSEHHRIMHPGSRFAVEGSVSRMHRLLLTGSRMNAAVCEWLVRYLLNPQGVESDPRARGFVVRGDGVLLVNDQIVSDKWQTYLKHTTLEPEARSISLSLHAISEPRRTRRSVEGSERYFRCIDLDVLADFADGHGIGTHAAIFAAVASDTGVEAVH